MKLALLSCTRMNFWFCFFSMRIIIDRKGVGLYSGVVLRALHFSTELCLTHFPFAFFSSYLYRDPFTVVKPAHYFTFKDKFLIKGFIKFSSLFFPPFIYGSSDHAKAKSLDLSDSWSLSLFSVVLNGSLVSARRDTWRAWLAQLVRSQPSDQKVPGSIPALPKFESLCDLLFCLS